MSTNQTEHYGLHLWEPEDLFVRTEFNENSERVDAAIRGAVLRADQAEQRVDSVNATVGGVMYNVYHLALLHHYEGHDTGWKRALVFDGFLSTAGIAQRSPALTVSGGRLSLERSSQGNISLGYFAAKMFSSVSTPLKTVTGNALFTGLRFKMNGNSTAPSVEYSVTLNGVKSQKRRHTFPTSPGGDYEVTLTLPTSIEVRSGDQIQVNISLPGWYLFFPESNRDCLGGTLLFTPLDGTTGTMTSIKYTLPAAISARAWVRHAGGTVALSLVSGGQTRPMTPGASRTVTDPQGGSCQEREFTLEDPLPAGGAAVKLDLSLGSASRMDVWDYGVALL